jgi:hypothetical protein
MSRSSSRGRSRSRSSDRNSNAVSRRTSNDFSSFSEPQKQKSPVVVRALKAFSTLALQGLITAGSFAAIQKLVDSAEKGKDPGNEVWDEISKVHDTLGRHEQDLQTHDEDIGFVFGEYDEEEDDEKGEVDLKEARRDLEALYRRSKQQQTKRGNRNPDRRRSQQRQVEKQQKQQQQQQQQQKGVDFDFLYPDEVKGAQASDSSSGFDPDIFD